MSDLASVRIDCDFNTGDDETGYWLLHHDHRPLAEQIDELGIGEGSTVILFAEADFQVPGIIRRGINWWGEETWLAFPDWTKRTDLT
ncbi:MAG TPA: hypothetical protein VIZ66_09525 [Sphingomicrobium sp.]